MKEIFVSKRYDVEARVREKLRNSRT